MWGKLFGVRLDTVNTPLFNFIQLFVLQENLIKIPPFQFKYKAKLLQLLMYFFFTYVINIYVIIRKRFQLFKQVFKAVNSYARY